MNIHPILVHFPIALLTLYALFECIRVKKIMALQEWMYLKAIFLFLGLGGALLAAATGDFGKREYPEARSIITMHETFAYTTIMLFGLLGLLYFVLLLDRFFGESILQTRYGQAWQTIARVAQAGCIGPVVVPTALLGLAVLFFTGALGGIIVYGPDADVFTKIVGRILLNQ